ncbi:MAG: NlpC/P60 family protein [Coriobacteriales bacterium]|jgi:hypothetical protein
MVHSLRKLVCTLLSCALVFSLCAVAPAASLAQDDPDVQTIDFPYEDQTFNLAVSGCIDFDYGAPVATAGFEHISISSEGSITGVSAGDATVVWYDEGGEPAYTFTIHVYEASVSTKSRTVYTALSEYDGISTSFGLPAGGANAQSTFEFEGDSLDDAWAWLDESGKCVHFEFSTRGMHVLTFLLDGRRYQVAITVIGLKLSPGFLMMYKGKSKKVVVNTGTRAEKWISSKKSVAKVSSSGKVTAKKKGIAIIRAYVKGIQLRCRVEVTSKKGYKAVKNGLKDLRTKLKYSQSKRMAKKYRDCSSFVSRCYWDPKLKRRLFRIGGKGISGWAYDAADQARWLNKHKRRVAKKAVSQKKLLPGDTIYYETDYAGKNHRYRHIDHAALYIGNGMTLQTGGYEGKGTVGYASYWSKDARVKFTGRPVR